MDELHQALLRAMQQDPDDQRARLRFFHSCLRAGKEPDITYLRPADLFRPEELPSGKIPEQNYDLYGAAEHTTVIYELVTRSQAAGKWISISRDERLPFNSQSRLYELIWARGVDVHQDDTYSLSDQTKHIILRRGHLRTL